MDCRNGAMLQTMAENSAAAEMNQKTVHLERKEQGDVSFNGEWTTVRWGPAPSLVL